MNDFCSLIGLVLIFLFKENMFIDLPLHVHELIISKPLMFLFLNLKILFTVSWQFCWKFYALFTPAR